MRFALATFIVALGWGAILATADEPAAVRLEGTRWVAPSADWAQVFAWADAQQRSLLSTQRKLGEAERVKLAALLQDAAAPMGKGFPWSTVLDARRMRHVDADSEHRLRTDGEGLLAQVKHDEKAAWVVALDFKRTLDAQMGPAAPIALAKVAGEPARKIFGLECVAYDLTGNGAGRVWIHVPAAERVDQLKAFAGNATRALGRLDSELFLAAVVQAGGIPVLALTDGVKGPSFTGNALGGKVVHACWTIDGATLAAEDTAIPEGYAQQHIPPR